MHHEAHPIKMAKRITRGKQSGFKQIRCNRPGWRKKDGKWQKVKNPSPNKA